MRRRGGYPVSISTARPRVDRLPVSHEFSQYEVGGGMRVQSWSIDKPSPYGRNPRKISDKAAPTARPEPDRAPGSRYGQPQDLAPGIGTDAPAPPRPRARQGQVCRLEHVATVPTEHHYNAGLGPSMAMRAVSVGCWRHERSSLHAPVWGGTAGSAGPGSQSPKFLPIERRRGQSLGVAGIPGPSESCHDVARDVSGEGRNLAQRSTH